MSKAQIIKKLQAYKAKPDVFQPLSPNELADLVVVVLSQVTALEKAINEGQLSISAKMTAEINRVLAEYKRDAEMTAKDVKTLAKDAESYVVSECEEMEKEVKDAIERLNARIAELKDGENGLVTEEEIQRAAEIALSMLELPDFNELISTQLTASPESVRDALELLSGDERYKVEINDVQGLTEALNQLSRNSGAGTIGKGQVYGFIRQAIADGTITSGGTTTFTGLTDTPATYTGQGAKLVSVKGDESGLEFIAPPSGSGDVIGPASSTNNNIALFDGVTGKTIKDSGVTTASFAPALGADDNYVTDAQKTIIAATTAAFTTADETKLNNITITQAVDLDALETASHAAVTVADSAEIDFTLTGQQISASIIAGSIDETKLDASVNASLDLADTAVQPAALSSYELLANKVTSISGASTDTQYPSAKLLYDQLALKLAIADIDDTPVNGETSAPISSNWAFDHTALAASDTVAGHVELAIASEVTTGTDATRAITPDAFAGSEPGKRTVGILVSGSASGDSALTTGDNKAAFPIDTTLNGMNLVAVKAYVSTVSSSGAPLFQVRRSRRSTATARTVVDMLTTGVSIDASEFESADAASAVSINTSNDDVQTGDFLIIDCDTAGTGVKGAQILLTFQTP